MLQPRVGVPRSSMPSAARSAVWFPASGGIDPYTHGDAATCIRTVGRGVHRQGDLRCAGLGGGRLHGRFPENRVLSHDLIEGCFARSGFIGDVELFEGDPRRLLADTSRRHRWIRGDWQIAAWLLPRVPATAGRPANPLSWLSRWKIVDNLRRSLTRVPLLLLLRGLDADAVVGRFLDRFGRGIVCSALRVCVASCACCESATEKPWKLHCCGRGGNVAPRLRSGSRSHGAILPYMAHYHLDAILRARWPSSTFPGGGCGMDYEGQRCGSPLPRQAAGSTTRLCGLVPSLSIGRGGGDC